MVSKKHQEAQKICQLKNDRRIYLTNSIVVSINNGRKTKLESYFDFVMALSNYYVSPRSQN